MSLVIMDIHQTSLCRFHVVYNADFSQ